MKPLMNVCHSFITYKTKQLAQTHPSRTVAETQDLGLPQPCLQHYPLKESIMSLYKWNLSANCLAEDAFLQFTSW